MAKKKVEIVSRSQAIRDYVAEHPDLGPRRIVKGLKQLGIDVSLGLASNVKYAKKRMEGRPPPKPVVDNWDPSVPRPGARSLAIRSYLEANPDAGSKEILSALKAQGLKVSPALINVVKHNMRDTQVAAAATPPVRLNGRTYAARGATRIREAKKLADLLGGLENAKRVLDLLEKLM